MADLSDKVSESEEMSSRNPSPERFGGGGGDGGAHLKTCVDCGTSKTPLWRGGPAGPKSLCNACGIRSRKKRRALLGINNKEEKKPKKSFSNNSSTSSSKSSTIVINHSNNDCNSSSSGENNTSSAVKKYGEYSLKKKLMAFGRDFAMQRPRSKKSKSKSNASQRRKMGEVEQAAFLLMALSCGSVYA